MPLALGLWAVIFAWRPVNFWLLMAAGTGVLGATAMLLHRGGPVREGVRQGDFLLGFASAAALYAVFWLGNRVLAALFPGSPGQVGAVYGIRSDAPGLLIGLLLVFPIGPGEELYWRGLIQAALAERLPGWAAVVTAAALYGAVHLVSRNPVLVLAAFVAGVYWGFLYLRLGRLWPIILSHVLWDLGILLLFPIR